MHELGIMTSVLDSAREAAQDAGALRLLSITLSVGEMTEAIEDALQFAFEALCEDDPFLKGATLRRAVAWNVERPSSMTGSIGSVPIVTASPLSSSLVVSCR